MIKSVRLKNDIYFPILCRSKLFVESVFHSKIMQHEKIPSVAAVEYIMYYHPCTHSNSF